MKAPPSLDPVFVEQIVCEPPIDRESSNDHKVDSRRLNLQEALDTYLPVRPDSQSSEECKIDKSTDGFRRLKAFQLKSSCKKESV